MSTRDISFSPMTASEPDEDAAVIGVAGRPRRSREELEALAANFVNSRLQKKVTLPIAPRGRRVPRAALAGGAALLVLGGLGWLLSGERDAAATSRVADADADAAAAPSWSHRLDAERERKRRELESGRNYLEKIASADRALLADMTSRAQVLESRATPAPTSIVAGELAPRVEDRSPDAASLSRGVAGAGAIGEPAAPPPDSAEKRAAALASAREQPAPPATRLASARASNCNIHVSELSSSGKLTYADVAHMKGARRDANGHVFTPPVPANGRTVVFEVLPTGCVRIARTR